MSPRAGIVLGTGLIWVGACLIDFFRRRTRGAHGF
jgi:hypothetical protein